MGAVMAALDMDLVSLVMEVMVDMEAMVMMTTMMTTMTIPNKHVRPLLVLFRQALNLFVHCHYIPETLPVRLLPKLNMVLIMQMGSVSGSGILGLEEMTTGLTHWRAAILFA